MPYFSFHYLMRHSKWVNNSRIINSQDIYTIYWGWGASGPFNPPYTFNNSFDFPLVFIDVFGFYSFAQSNLQILCFGPFIKDAINQGGGEFSKRWSYLIRLFSKSDDEGGGGSKISKKMMTSFMNGPFALMSLNLRKN